MQNDSLNVVLGKPHDSDMMDATKKLIAVVLISCIIAFSRHICTLLRVYCEWDCRTTKQKCQ
jgi:hypothetical protein